LEEYTSATEAVFPILIATGMTAASERAYNGLFGQHEEDRDEEDIYV